MPKAPSLPFGQLLVFGALALFFGLQSGSAAGQETSTLCHFNSGPRAGQTQDYAPMAPIAVGSSCQDARGSAGVVISRANSAAGSALDRSSGANRSIAPATTAVSGGDFSGAWVLRGDFRLNGVLDSDAAARPQQFNLMITPTPTGAYTGTFVGMPDPSTFTLSFSQSSRGEVLQMLQVHTQVGYYAAYVGHLAQGSSGLSVQGSWVDVDNNTGDFTLTRETPRTRSMRLNPQPEPPGRH